MLGAVVGENGFEVGLNDEALTFNLFWLVGESGLFTAFVFAFAATLAATPFAPFATDGPDTLVVMGGAIDTLLPLNGGIA